MKRFNSFEEMNEATGFESKAGFTLEPRQVDGVNFLSTFPRVGNFSDVGCGKTVMATALSMVKGPEVTLVTVPPILIPQWVTWLQNFSKDVVRYQGTPTYRAKLDLGNARWIVMSHAIFRQDYEYLRAKALRPSMEIIVDEAQALKNSASVLFKYVNRLSSIADVQLLTGTPTTKPTDAYSYIKLKTPTVFRSYGHFENTYVVEKDFFKQPVKYGNLDHLADTLALQTVKYTKEEVFGYNLTPIYTTIPYDLDRDHKRLYDKLVEEQLLLLDNGAKIDATTPVRLYHALQQIVCNWAHFSGEPHRSAAYDILDEVVEDTNCLDVTHSKLIVWTYYKMTSRNVLEYCHKQWPGTTVAAYSEVDSAKSVKSFMEDPRTRILIAQPSSAGMGLNPAHLCSEVLFLEASTSPMQIRQAIGRVDRKGQTVRPTIRFAEAIGTIQKTLYGRLASNDDLVIRVENLKDSLRDALFGR